MRVKRLRRFNHLLQIKISDAHSLKLREASVRTGVNMAELARLSLRLGLPKLLAKLPEVTND